MVRICTAKLFKIAKTPESSVWYVEKEPFVGPCRRQKPLNLSLSLFKKQEQEYICILRELRLLSTLVSLEFEFCKTRKFPKAEVAGI